MAHATEVLESRGHHLVGVRWPVTGSKGDKYTVELTDYGFDCNCIAYRKCKHIKSVEERFQADVDF